MLAKDVEKSEPLCIPSGNIKRCRCCGKHYGYFSKKKKLSVELPYDPVIPLMGIYTKELKAGTQTDICTPLFITTLFTIAKR